MAILSYQNPSTPTATLDSINIGGSPEVRREIVVVRGAALTPSSPTAFSVGVASGQALAANANRTGLVLVNTSSNSISLGLGIAAVLNSGITLNPNGGTYIMDDLTFTTAAINAIASGATSNLGIQEYA